jgi:hypothetical protein
VLLSILLYIGLLLVVISPFLLIPRRTRRRALLCAAMGLLMMVVAIVWPAREQRVAIRTTHLDQAMPVCQFNEQHSTSVDAPPERIFQAIHAVTADDIFLFRTLIAIRRMGRPLPPGILNAPPNESLLDLATRTSFRYLSNDPPRELVVGTIIVPPEAVLATMNFRVTPEKNGSLLSTETRVFAKTDSARRRFAVYWRLIHPGSDIIRRMWLRAIKQRAEAGL